MINEQRLLDTFLELVQIDSETGHEATIQPFLKSLFKSLGLQVVEDEAGQQEGFGANNLICTLAPTQGEETITPIYFTSHMDTVVPGCQVQPQVKEDGYIYSDGTTILGADDKAGLAAIIELIRTLQEQDIAHGQIQFVITVGEESGLLGARALNPELLNAKYGFAIDASQPVGTTVIGAPTQVKVDATAHASTPNKGVSAINIAAKAISRMKLGQIDDVTTANIGRFEGGSATNIVADEVTIHAEARSHDTAKVEAQVQHMKETFESTAEQHGTSAHVTITTSYPGFKIAEDAEVTQIARRSAEALNLESRTVIAGGGSDGNIINGFGIPTVILGVGYEHIHTTSERIAIEELNRLTAQLIEIVKTVRQ
ncbi:M20/M25/M40 family metallo-hydrolase [Staphylococcus pettenkoferi]|uniref:M20/M25/M40 family metallo-hydrolase n=1 Tax=Staphylococcus pettenkoferi TaxID=170573 RepID=UPI002276E7CE|nr:M20/M25/M40 family metallo-hydrolase [Staphylococcus pettenkoferi]MCY1609083.1 M20/M25/M40 family metallo-hydrolase [Staphylococcus pettenkoferi]